MMCICWAAVEAIGTWVAAFGTIAAVTTALYFGVYQNRPKLKIQAGITFGQNVDLKDRRWIISIVNTRTRVATMLGFYWSIGRRGRNGNLIPDIEQINSEDHPPYKLEDGDPKFITMDFERLKRLAKYLYEIDPKNIQENRIRTLRVFVKTTSDDQFDASVQESMLLGLIEAANAVYPNMK